MSDGGVPQTEWTSTQLHRLQNYGSRDEADSLPEEGEGNGFNTKDRSRTETTEKTLLSANYFRFVTGRGAGLLAGESNARPDR